MKKDFGIRLEGTDTEDGSTQALELECREGRCDITLIDASFFTCIKNIPVSQGSLDNFRLDPYCVKSFAELTNVIDYDAGPTTTLDGSILMLEDGIIRRIGPNFTYYNYFKDEVPGKKSGKKKGFPKRTSLTSGSYRGSKYFDGFHKRVIATCTGIYQVTLFLH